MRQYLKLLEHVMLTGVDKADRTGTGTRSVFGYQMRYDLREGFPAVTTKKLFHRGYIHELLMFLKGETNNQYLLDLDVHIWDNWMLKEDLVDREQVLLKKGELGPVYGLQWRSWKGANGETIDQLAEVIKLLRTNPDSRRMIVTAWNPADLPDESVSPQENVKNGKMALAACHCMFQFYTTPLTIEQRVAAHNERVARCEQYYHASGDATHEMRTYRYIAADALHVWSNIKKEDFTENDAVAVLDRLGAPSRSLSCQLYQRSCDLFLGVPFNIASYALLTHMLAQVCNMDVGEFIWTGGDCHIYSNHFDQVIEQTRRLPMDLPRLWLNPEIKEIDQFTFDDIRIIGYNSHGVIKAPVSV